MDTSVEETKSSTESKQSADKKQKQITISIKAAIVIGVIIVVGALAYRYKGLLVAATVNGSPISRFSVIEELEKKSGKATLDALIIQKLIAVEAQKKGITVNDNDVNAEIKKIEEQLKEQGKTLAEALSAQGMTEEDLRVQLATQKKLEKLLADKIQVTDEEIAQFIKDSKIVIPAGQEDSYKNQARDQIQQNKLNDAVGVF
ncbi:MAG TPA: SurA N-terminal domain-containing protein, partial [Candidatus Paceibacterota bacterium]